MSTSDPTGFEFPELDPVTWQPLLGACGYPMYGVGSRYNPHPLCPHCCGCHLPIGLSARFEAGPVAAIPSSAMADLDPTQPIGVGASCHGGGFTQEILDAFARLAATVKPRSTSLLAEPVRHAAEAPVHTVQQQPLRAIADGPYRIKCPTCTNGCVPSFGDYYRCSQCNAELLPPEGEGA